MKNTFWLLEINQPDYCITPCLYTEYEKGFARIWEYIKSYPNSAAVHVLMDEYRQDFLGGYTDANFYHYCEQNVDWSWEEALDKYGMRLVEVRVEE